MPSCAAVSVCSSLGKHCWQCSLLTPAPAAAPLRGAVSGAGKGCAQTQHCLESLLIPSQRSMSFLSSLLVQSQGLTLNLWTAERPPKLSVEKYALQGTSQLGPALGMSKQPLEINLSPSMAHREGGKNLQIEVCISKSTCETIVQTPTATERGWEWDSAPTAACAIQDASVYLTHLHRAATCDSGTCRRPKPFYSRSWEPSRMPEGCLKGSRCLCVGYNRCLNSDVLSWAGPHWLHCHLLWATTNSWCSLH